ncbi:MAG: zinc-ribbon domain-containing protein [Oscillospiraceae bacterium]|nr:zinc-ribbon domain-containing protein [Oscillospiraceae bacterium]
MGFCTNCGSSRPENATFCMKCGSKFDTGASVPAHTPDIGTILPPPPPPAPAPAPVPEPSVPEWLNQPDEVPSAASANTPPPYVYANPTPQPISASMQSYIIPDKLTKKKTSPLFVISMIILALALFAGGFFGSNFLLNNFLSSLF